MLLANQYTGAVIQLVLHWQVEKYDVSHKASNRIIILFNYLEVVLLTVYYQS